MSTVSNEELGKLIRAAIQREEQKDPEVQRQEEARRRLLNAAQHKPVRRVIQYDYFDENTGATDHDGDDDMFCSVTYELRNTECLRVQFPDDWGAAKVLAALHKLLVFIDQTYTDENDFWRRHQGANCEKDAAPASGAEENPFRNDPPAWLDAEENPFF